MSDAFAGGADGENLSDLFGVIVCAGAAPKLRLWGTNETLWLR